MKRGVWGADWYARRGFPVPKGRAWVRRCCDSSDSRTQPSMMGNAAAPGSWSSEMRGGVTQARLTWQRTRDATATLGKIVCVFVSLDLGRTASWILGNQGSRNCYIKTENIIFLLTPCLMVKCQMSTLTERRVPMRYVRGYKSLRVIGQGPH